MKHDILTRADVVVLVDTFYDKIAVDPLLGGIFHGALGTDWAPHLTKMYRFWETILLNQSTYSGRPFAPHARMPLHAEHFDQWIALFHATIDDLYEGDNAQFAKKQAVKMGELFMNKLTFMREHPDRFIQ